ncbi:hypothetical protein [Streptomyces sp. NRRL B-3648]|uniref:hypothetical protein n=1 Tax=Streptomyces sp. NRRL B-3648 TaxID=1519493 RepID=UPI0006AEF11D|nr:hypothetical protein [Streptomyces sp. NRRL B-3648]KOX03629.1 hypothetical protein ADL04_10395 [Streptomyces sp. NRRL B-3648]
MPTRTRALRFTAVLTLVVLSLTGFSSGRHHGSRGSGGGGGCSSSHQDHDGSSSSTSGGGSYGSSGGSGGSSYGSGGSSYGSDDDYGSTGSTGGGSYRRTHRPTSTPSGGGSGAPLKEGTARLIACATAGKPYATVEVTNPNSRKAAFTVEVLFLPESPPAIDSGRTQVSVAAHGTRTVRVPFTQQAHTDLLDHCEVDGTARLAH